MITYKKADFELIDTVLKMRRETCACVSGKDEIEFEGEFTLLSKEFFKHGDQTTVLAFDGEMAVGCATICFITVMPTAYHTSGKRAHIMNVYTKAEYRRRGIARKMITMLLDEARERGVTYVSLDTTENGRPLYRSLGFSGNKENMGLNL